MVRLFWMNKLPVSCDEQDATRKNIKPRSHTAINFFLLVRVRYVHITMMEMYPNLCQPGSTTTSAAAWPRPRPFPRSPPRPRPRATPRVRRPRTAAAGISTSELVELSSYCWLTAGQAAVRILAHPHPGWLPAHPHPTNYPLPAQTKNHWNAENMNNCISLTK